MNLTELIREAYFASDVIQAEELRDLVFDGIHPDDYAEALRTALLPLCSTQLSGLSREPVVEPQKSPMPRPGRKPKQYKAEAQRHRFDSRPFSVAQGVRVMFKDMTVDHWKGWIERRYAKSTGALREASWGERVIEKMTSHNVLTSGLLPDSVKEELFTKEASDV